MRVLSPTAQSAPRGSTRAERKAWHAKRMKVRRANQLARKANCIADVDAEVQRVYRKRWATKRGDAQ